MNRIPESITITISRTIQVKQYEPLTVTVTETYQCEEDDDLQEVRNAAYKQVADSVAKYLKREYKRYTED